MSWSMVAMGALSFAGSLFGGRGKKQVQYQPNPEWLAMREDVMRGIRTGLEQGGYTWSDEMGEQLYRGALENISQSYSGAERRVVESMAPLGNRGAIGRTMTNLNISRAQEESKAGRDLSIARESEKLKSYSNLLQLGAGTPDPNLPSLQADMFNASQPTSNIWGALETGVATYANLASADKREGFYNKLFERMVPPQSPVATPSNIGGAPTWPVYSGSART